MPSWPSGLRRPRAEGFSDEPTPGYVEFSSDKPGSISRRQVTTAAPSRMSFSISCSAANVATIEAFYRATLGLGSLRFDWTHPVSGVAISAQFAQPPRFAPHRGVARWLAHCQLNYWR